MLADKLGWTTEQNSLLDASAREGGDDVGLPGLLNVTQNDVLVGRQPHWQLISLNHPPEGLLQVTLQPAILDVDAVCQLAITLVHPP
jgi:hypothetical protein